MASRVHGLREAEYLANAERNVCRIRLKIVFDGKAILLAEVVVDVAIDLAGVKLARRTLDEGIEGLVSALGVLCVRGWNDELSSRRFCVENGQCYGVHVGRADAGGILALAASVIRVHK